MINIGPINIPLEVAYSFLIMTAVFLSFKYIGFEIISAIFGVLSTIYGSKILIQNYELIIQNYIFSKLDAVFMICIGLFLVYRGYFSIRMERDMSSWR